MSVYVWVGVHVPEIMKTKCSGLPPFVEDRCYANALCCYYY